MVADDKLMEKLSVATKLVPLPAVIATLFEAGQAAAAGFLDAHKDKIGVESSVNLPEMFG